MSEIASLLADKVIDGQGNKVDIKSQYSGKVLGIYFSAHWCPPCRGFTPVLCEFYKKHHESKNFEVVFVSSDKNDEEFKKYFAEMPWHALNFDERTLKDDLVSKFTIRGIPTFALVDFDSEEILTISGRSGVTDDPEASKFPWKI